jgi:acyl-CoA thioesterase-1
VGGRRAWLGLVAGLAMAGAGLAGLATLWPRPGAAPRGVPPDGPVVFLGDSITSGHRLPQTAAFPHLVGEALGIRVINAGISGDTTDGGLARLERDVLAHGPRLVVVELGVNDAFRRLPPDRTLANLRAITRRVRGEGAGVILVHIALPATIGDGHRAALRAIAEDEDATLVEDFLAGVVPALSYDGLHPDPTGQARLAERLVPVLRDALGR